MADKDKKGHGLKYFLDHPQIKRNPSVGNEHKDDDKLKPAEAVDKVLSDKKEVQDVLPKVKKGKKDDTLKKMRELKQSDYPAKSVHGYDKKKKKK